MEGEEDDFEHTLYACPSVRCFKVPPMTTQKGFNSGEWTNGDQIWTGRLRVVEKGSHTCRVLLEDTESGELFAECPYVAGKRMQTIFDAQDSSRYFVLRIQGEGGRHAFVGLGFSERNHSFDFNVALGEHEKHARLAEREKEEAARAEASYAAAPKVDRSLKQGETITIALKKPGAAADGSKAKPSWMSNAKASGGLGGVKLAPPGAPGAIRKPTPSAPAPAPAPASPAPTSAPAASAPTRAAGSSSAAIDPFAALTDLSAAAPAPAAAANDPFAALSAPPPAAAADPFAAIGGDPFSDLSQSVGGALPNTAPPKSAPPPSSWAQF